MNNPLIQKFNTPYLTAPFHLIEPEHFLPAIKHHLKSAEEEIELITKEIEQPTFQNTIEALAFSGEQLEITSSLLFNLNSADTSAEIQKTTQEVSPLLTEHASKIAQNEELFARIKTVHDEKSNLNLSKEEVMLLDTTYKSFVRAGALLSEEKKQELEVINKELSLKSLKFGENLLESTNAYYKQITDPEQLKGIPEGILEMYRNEAEDRELEGYVITLDYPSYLPALTYLENRELRKELYLANGKKAFDGGELDNQELIKEITHLRQRKATLLGYNSFAHYVLEERMAQSPEKVKDFLTELLDKATPFAHKEVEELKKLATQEGVKIMEAWDHAYYAEKLRKIQLDFNDQELRPYFELKSCLQAVFDLAGKLYGLKFELAKDIEGYHKDVTVYRVLENKELKAVLYTDFHPRKSKRAGAWMTTYRNQMKKEGKDHRPHISVVCNFSKPTSSAPSLLTFQELTTLFHEFGHALHGIMADTTYPSLSGTSVKWDFVELPSQFMENYCYEPELLSSFAQHYETKEKLDQEKIAKLSASKSFLEGYQTLRQIGFGLLDLSYHTQIKPIVDIKEFETRATKLTSLYPVSTNTAISPSFAHIFQGGYAAGYYSYKWAEVLDADAFELFKEKGIFNKPTAEKFKELLSKGGSQAPMELYKNFRGREPKIESLLNRAFGQ